MGQRDLARMRPRASADQARVGNGVVRGTEGTITDEGLIWGQQVSDGIDAGHIQGFFDGHVRQYRWQRSRQEGLASKPHGSFNPP